MRSKEQRPRRREKVERIGGCPDRLNARQDSTPRVSTGGSHRGSAAATGSTVCRVRLALAPAWSRLSGGLCQQTIHEHGRLLACRRRPEEPKIARYREGTGSL